MVDSLIFSDPLQEKVIQESRILHGKFLDIFVFIGQQDLNITFKKPEYFIQKLIVFVEIWNSFEEFREICRRDLIHYEIDAEFLDVFQVVLELEEILLKNIMKISSKTSPFQRPGTNQKRHF